MVLDKKASGFTLIELATVLVIAGIIVAGASSLFSGQADYAKVKKTQERMKTIQLALAAYVAENGLKFPCVASMKTTPGSPKYGVSETVCDGDGNHIDANGDTIWGTWNGAGRDPDGLVTGPLTGNVRTGAVPVRTLGLSPEFMYDGWGQRFFYSVSENQVLNGYNAKNGSIFILDSAGNDATDPRGNALYVIASVGPDGKGGYNADGTSVKPYCNEAPGLDRENCDHDARYVSTTQYSVSKSDTHFDDYIVYETILLDLIGVSVATTRIGPVLLPVHSQSSAVPTCPMGWTQLHTGYSFVGSGIGDSADDAATGDLGKPGSCLPQFKPAVFSRCTHAGVGNGTCDLTDTGFDASYWLNDGAFGEIPIQSGTSASSFDVGRCVLCASDLPVMAVHSMDSTLPSCPTDWTPMWGGYSLGFIGGTSVSGNPDLTSPGSCLPEFRANPIIACSPGTPNAICKLTEAVSSYWLTSRGGFQDIANETGNDASDFSIGRCQVCQGPVPN